MVAKGRSKHMEMTLIELVELVAYILNGLMKFFLHVLIGIGAVAGVSLVFAIDQAIQNHKK